MKQIKITWQANILNFTNVSIAVLTEESILHLFAFFFRVSKSLDGLHSLRVRWNVVNFDFQTTKTVINKANILT